MKIFACPEVDFPKGHQPPSYGCLCPFPVNRVAFHIAAWALKSSNRCSGNRYWRSERTEPSPRCSDSGSNAAISSHPCLARCWMLLNLSIAVLGGSDQIYPGHLRVEAAGGETAIDECEYPSHGLVTVPPAPRELCFHARNLWILNLCQVAIFRQSAPTISSKLFGWHGI